jgi:hypothetical protein
VNEHRFFNPHQPQTLQFGVILCYIDAVLGLLSAQFLTGLLIAVGLAVGAFGIANEKKWGYALAVAAAVLQLLTLVVIFRFGVLSDIGVLIPFAFDAALVGLLLHPMSRDYQRIWFK